MSMKHYTAKVAVREPGETIAVGSGKYDFDFEAASDESAIKHAWNKLQTLRDGADIATLFDAGGNRIDRTDRFTIPSVRKIS